MRIVNYATLALLIVGGGNWGRTPASLVLILSRRCSVKCLPQVGSFIRSSEGLPCCSWFRCSGARTMAEPLTLGVRVETKSGLSLCRERVAQRL